MAEIVNLRTVRKRQARAEKEAVANQNRHKFGRTKAGKLAAEAEQRRSASLLESKKLED